MKPEEFRAKLVKMVKAAGQEIIDRAEDLVGEGDLLSDFDILVNFSSDGGMFHNIPVIEVTKSYCSKRIVNVLCEEDNND